MLRRRNREQILQFIAGNQATTRSALADVTGLTPAAISRITREMIDVDLLLEGDHLTPSVRAGRRETVLTINPKGAYVLAISLTANRRSVILADAKGKTVVAKDCDDLDLTSPHDVLRAMADRAKALVYDANINSGRLLGVGVSAAISEGGSATNVTSAPLGWHDIPVQSSLSKYLNLPVKVEHRASAILRAELNQRNPATDCYLINVALRNGVSAYLNGSLHIPGAKGFGSLSHFRVQGNDRDCTCGRRGCLDACASGMSILAELGRADCGSAESSRRLVTAVLEAEAGDAKVCAAFRRAGENMAHGIDAVMSLFSVETVILAGEVGRQRDFIDGTRSALKVMRNIEGRIDCSNVTSNDAAISVALQEFVLTDSLNLVQLKAA